MKLHRLLPAAWRLPVVTARAAASSACERSCWYRRRRRMHVRLRRARPAPKRSMLATCTLCCSAASAALVSHPCSRLWRPRHAQG